MTKNYYPFKLIRYKLGALHDFEQNPVQLSEHAAKKLAEQLKRGQDLPYVAAAPPNGKAGLPLLDGHQRKAVSLSINHVSPDTLVPVLVPARKMTEREKKQWIVEHRKNTGEWDFDILANNFDVPDLLEWGFSEKELLGAGFEFEDTTQDAEPQIDRAAELLKKWKVKTGDLWQIGEHRLICGDCTDAAVVARVMGGERADMCVTDPPYGVLEEKWDRMFSQSDLDMIFSVTSGMVACFNAAKPEIVLHMLSLSPTPDRIGVWRHSQISPKPGMIWSWQPVFYWRCKDAKAWDSLDWYQGNSDKDGTHPTQKPVEFFVKIIGSLKGVIVYEPFCGSGTCLVACQNLNRRGRGIEISPAYCAVTLQRMSDAFPGIEIKRVK